MLYVTVVCALGRDALIMAKVAVYNNKINDSHNINIIDNLGMKVYTWHTLK